MALMMWIVYWLEWRYEVPNSSYGLFPRDVRQLYGILSSPLLHGSLKHLFSNTFPIIILGSAVAYFYREIKWKVFGLSIILPGILTWIFAREAYHIGASGVVYTLAFFIFFSGLLRGHPTLIALSLLIAFLYGSLVWGILPIDPKVSYESHGMGGIAGIALALIFRKTNPNHQYKHFWQKDRYQWDEAEEAMLEEMDYWKTDEQIKNQIEKQSFSSTVSIDKVIYYIVKNGN
jgi:membrane associated rhomboid family serine protease